MPSVSASGASDASKGNPLFGDGNIPKNKDVNGFTREVQSKSAVQEYMERRFLRTAHSQGFRTSSDLPSDHSFGKRLRRDHDMVAILTNKYQDDLAKVTVDALRASTRQRRIPQPKPTYAQLIRDRLVRSKFSSTSLSLGRAPSIPRASSA